MDQPTAEPILAARTAADPHAEARNRMVDGQIRPNKVTDARIIQAMRRLPRERFVPASLTGVAYVDEDLPLGEGRALVEPMVIARLVQLARIRPGERALVVGAGTGYGAALMAACGAVVTALEQDARLLEIARRALRDAAPAVRIVEGPLAAGLADGAPWDVIMIEGAVQEIPPAVGAQVRADGGRLVTVLARTSGAGQGVVAEASPGADGRTSMRPQAEFDCATPLLPPLLAAAAFRF